MVRQGRQGLGNWKSQATVSFTKIGPACFPRPAGLWCLQVCWGWCAPGGLRGPSLCIHTAGVYLGLSLQPPGSSSLEAGAGMGVGAWMRSRDREKGREVATGHRGLGPPRGTNWSFSQAAGMPGPLWGSLPPARWALCGHHLPGWDGEKGEGR